MGIGDFLFGKKKYYDTNKLGTFTTRVRNENTVRKYVWKSSTPIANYSKNTTILLEGDAYEPLKSHLETVTWIVDNIDKLDKEIISKVNSDSELKEKFNNKNLSDLRIDLIFPSFKELYKFELSYISNSDTDFYMTVLIQNKQIVGIQ